MFAYCRNNPVCRKDVSGTEDVCVDNCNEDDTPLNDLGNPSGRGSGSGSVSVGGSGSSGGNGGLSGHSGPSVNGGKPSGGQSSPSYNTGNSYNAKSTVDTGQAPKQGASGTTYTQISSDGKGRTVSVTTYGAYDRPVTRVDYLGRDHNIGLPHIHRFDWGYYNGGIKQTGETILPYIKE